MSLLQFDTKTIASFLFLGNLSAAGLLLLYTSGAYKNVFDKILAAGKALQAGAWFFIWLRGSIAPLSFL